MLKPCKVLLITGLTLSCLAIFSLSSKATTKEPENHSKKANSVIKIITTDGSDKQASTPFARKMIKILESRFTGQRLIFRNLKLHTSPDSKQSFCGEMSISLSNPPDEDSFIPFGIKEGEDSPVVYDPEDIPESLDLRQEDKYINRGADLEELEEMGCVPEGTYRHYSDKLTEIIEHREASMIR